MVRNRAELTRYPLAPALVEKDAMPVERGLKHTTRAQKRNNVIIQQTVAQPNIVIVNQNLGAINNLARLAELEFLALVKSQVTLLQTIEAIKNNIRINTFRSRFTQVVSQDCPSSNKRLLHSKCEKNNKGFGLTLLT